MDSSARQHAVSVLTSDDPEASRTLNATATAPIMLVCDHASNRVPQALNNLGLDASTLDRHVAWDKGTNALTERLVERLGYSAVLCNYSRLVIDCNRRIEDPTLIPGISDDVLVPGNQDLSTAAREARFNEIYVPYHRAVSAQLDALSERVEAPALVAVHSFTPKLETGDQRPWHVGVLWDKDARIAAPLLEYLRRDSSLCVGDNEPYSGKHPADYTIDHHGEERRLPCVSIEIRQDLLSTAEGIEQWTHRLSEFFEQLQCEVSLFTTRQ